jgi:hypothetical protein
MPRSASPFAHRHDDGANPEDGHNPKVAAYREIERLDLQLKHRHTSSEVSRARHYHTIHRQSPNRERRQRSGRFDGMELMRL